MSVIGDFSIPAASFALEEALSREPEVTVEADRLASHSTMEVLPFLWASGGDLGAFQRALEDDPTVREASVVEDAEDAVLFKPVWSDEFRGLIDDMVDHHAAILEAEATGDTWHLKLRFAEEGMVSEFQQHFRETGHRFEVHQLTRPSESHQREFGLTEAQYEALVAAAEDGYFQVPRGASVEDLGERLDISANSISQRLRRGTETLVRNALSVTEDGNEP